MTGTSILGQVFCWLPSDNHPSPVQEVNLKLKEQEWLSLLKRCNSLEEFKQAHGQVLKLGLFCNSFCASNLLATCALSPWGSMKLACSIFNQICEPGTFDFNTMIKGCVKNFDFETAVCLYYDMLESGVQPDKYTYPGLLKACGGLKALEEGIQLHGQIFKLGLVEDLYVANSLINMYGKCGEIVLSCSVFEGLEHKDAASWSSIISAHAGCRMWEDCLQLLGQMCSEGSCRPTESILVSALSACTHLGTLDAGRCIHGSLLRNVVELNVIVQTSLVEMYAKCGCIDKAMSLFHRMIKKNKLSYSVIITGLAMHGRATEALKVFSDMLEVGLQPDDIVYVGILSACSHAGLVDKGMQAFDQMRLEHGINPTIQHYGCMVDLMARAGQLNEALEFIRRMPVEANDIIWRSLLGACKIHQNPDMADIAAKNLFQLNDHNPSDYLMLSNIYSQAQRWEKVEAIRTRMYHKGLTQTPGSTSVEARRQVHKFVSQDKSHPRCKEIYDMIHQMEWQLKFEGYSADTSQVLFNVDEDEKKQRLRAHSQKLALAFALISTSPEAPIRIARNLRMCSDCHTYTKLISFIYDREIVVRERHWFHHFKDGACSCKDYWTTSWTQKRRIAR